jgi:parallel beta-helix repeat protein
MILAKQLRRIIVTVFVFTLQADVGGVLTALRSHGSLGLVPDLFEIPAASAAVTRYVSPAGSGSACSSSSPCSYTTAKAATAAGDVITLLEGEYDFNESSLPNGISASLPTTVQGSSSLAPSQVVIRPRSGIAFTFGNENRFIKIANLRIDASLPGAAGINIRDDVATPSTDLLFEDLEVTNDNARSSAIFEAGRRHTFRRLYLYQIGAGSHDHGLYGELRDAVVEDSIFEDIAGWAIHCFSVCGNPIIRYSIFRRYGSGGITLHRNTSTGARIYNNVLYKGMAGSDAHGGVRVSGARNATADFIDGNTIVNNVGIGIDIEAGAAGTCRNNIALGNTFAQIRGRCTEATNITTGMLTDVFLNPGEDDYSLRPGSVAIDAGTDLSAELDDVDILGTARPQQAKWDIGAYEFAGAGSESGSPGVDNPVGGGSSGDSGGSSGGSGGSSGGSGGSGGGSPAACDEVGSNFFVGCYYRDRNLNTLAMVQNSGSIDFDWDGGSPGSAVPSDNFSARWQGDFDFSSGPYEFAVTADDGVRLYIDGQLVVDRWIDQSPTTYRVTRQLSAGRHRIVMEYYENGGGAVARLSFSATSTAVSSPSPSDCSDVGINFFVGCYYNDMNLSSLALTQNTALIDFDWGGRSPDSAVRVDNFSARWQGDFDMSAGQYDFTVVVDDGMRLYVDGELVIDRWIDQPPTTYTVTRLLSSGRHRIVMEYYERGGGAVARLSWVKR